MKRETPLINTAGNTINRLSEGAAVYGNNEIKTMPGSTQSTKRNSIAANIASSEKSVRGSAQNYKE